MLQKSNLHLGALLALFIFLAIGCKIAGPPSSTMTNSTPNPLQTDPTKDKIKTFLASTDDLGKLGASNNISPKPKIDGKVAIVYKNTAGYFSMVGLDKYANDYDELSIRNYGFTKDDLALSRDEINYLIQDFCSQGKQIGSYDTTDGRILAAYELKCEVSVIHFKDKDTREYIAKKTFTSRKLDKDIKVASVTDSVSASMPTDEIEKYIKSMVDK